MPPSHVRGSPLNPGAPSRLRQIRSSSGTHSQAGVRQDRNAPGSQPARQDFFRSSRNVEVSGGNFNNTLDHSTNVTVNVNGELEHPSREIAISRIEQPHRQDQTQGERNPANDTPQKSSEIYARLLCLKGRGFPLWIPEPHRNLPMVYRRKGVNIGDVGIITPRGGFSFLFNVFASNDHPTHPPQLPERFTPLSPSPDAIDICMDFELKPGNYLASSSVEKSESDSASGLSFKMSASEGAILTMPEGALSEDLENVARIRKYVAANLMDWYRYVNGPRGRDARNGDIRVVVGYDKSTSWGMATMTNATQEMSCELRFKSLPDDSTSGSSVSTYVWEHSGLAEVRAGPDVQDIERLREGDPSTQRDGKYTNQCLFLRTMNPTLGKDEWLKLCQELDTPELASSNYHSLAADNLCHHNVTQNSSQSTLPGGSHGSIRPSSQQGSGNGGSYVLSTGRESIRDRASGVSMSNPPTAISFHPSRIVNEMLLKKIPDAKMVLTEDSNWCSIFNEVIGVRFLIMPMVPKYCQQSNHSVPSDEEFFARVLEGHHIENDNGVVFLEDKRPLQGRTGLLVSTSAADMPPSVPSDMPPSPPATKSSLFLSHIRHHHFTIFDSKTSSSGMKRRRSYLYLLLVTLLLALAILLLDEISIPKVCRNSSSSPALVKIAGVCIPDSYSPIPAMLYPNKMATKPIEIGKVSAALASIGTPESRLVIDAEVTVSSLSKLSYTSALTQNTLASFAYARANFPEIEKRVLEGAMDAWVEGLHDELKGLLSQATEVLANLDGFDLHLKQVMRTSGYATGRQWEKKPDPQAVRDLVARFCGERRKNLCPLALEAVSEALINENNIARKAVVQLSIEAGEWIMGIKAAYRQRRGVVHQQNYNFSNSFTPLFLSRRFHPPF